MIEECNFKYKPFVNDDSSYCQISESTCPEEKNCILYQIYNKLDELSYSEDNQYY